STLLMSGDGKRDGALPSAPALVLDSTISQEDNAAAEMDHAEKVLSVSFISHNQTAEVLQPGKQPFDPPTVTVSSQASPILSSVLPVAAMWRDELYTIPAYF